MTSKHLLKTVIYKAMTHKGHIQQVSGIDSCTKDLYNNFARCTKTVKIKNFQGPAGTQCDTISNSKVTVLMKCSTMQESKQ